MRRSIVILLVGCGARSTTQSSTPIAEPTPDAALAFQLDKVPTPDELCKRVRDLAANQCRPFVEWPVEMLDNCVIHGAYTSGAQACYLETTCDRFDECTDYVIDHGAPYRGPTSPCVDQMRTLPAGVTETEMAESYGRTATKYSEAPSSKERPIEVCGIPEESVYLMRATCDDGSKPFANFRSARQSRTGNVGTGGRCRRMIDRFEVTCPERRYEVFIDAYRCPANPL